MAAGLVAAGCVLGSLPVVADAAARATSWAGWSDAPAWVSPASQIQWYVAAPSVTTRSAGQPVTFTVTPSPSATLDCTTLAVGLARGTRWTTLTPIAATCSPAGATYKVVTDASMVGATASLHGWAAPAGSARSFTFDGRVATGARVSKTVATAQRPADPDNVVTPPAPVPTASPTTTPTMTPKPTAAPTPTAAVGFGVIATAAPASPAPTAAPTSAAPSAAPTSQAPAPVAPVGGAVPSLDLPRVPWEGGASYYAKFADAARGGWTSPDHFPIMLWFGGGVTDSQVKFDKSYGINTYLMSDASTNYKVLEQNGVSYISDKPLNGQPRNSPVWVGEFLDDEIDGRMEPAAGISYLKQRRNAMADHNKFAYANFTGMVISWYSLPAWNAAATQFVNDITDVVSLDAYWFSGPQCSWDNPHGTEYLEPFTKAGCRTPQTYGDNVASLRKRDAEDGKLQPIYNFIENVNVAPDREVLYRMSPSEVKGAAMSSIINEARGLVWFNQSFGGECSTGNAVRAVQNNPGYACRNLVDAMGEVNREIQGLAPVLNTQSYKWDFGPDVETMLKVHDGSAYVFAMTTADSPLGQRTFKLPPQLQGRPIQVVNENRTIAASGGQFTDSFAQRGSYHIYKIG
ncbi:hypothetical protein [Nigerium massiliense]|uniref:hypothetical protein n=1 Tax=Nigerium massiliense TaxID=1522317 RepID=UPI000694E34E|nr:hypothetical protein [Nigerium massiliense]